MRYSPFMAQTASRRWPQKTPAQVRRMHMAARHGPYGEADFAMLWDRQQGCCYLCGESMILGPDVCVEHDHRCCPRDRSCQYCRRGLACQRCNSIIARAADDPALLRLIADNLEAALPAVAAKIATKPVQDALM